MQSLPANAPFTLCRALSDLDFAGHCYVVFPHRRMGALHCTSITSQRVDAVSLKNAPKCIWISLDDRELSNGQTALSNNRVH